MEKIVILISTREYSPESDEFIDVESKLLDEFITNSDILDDYAKDHIQLTSSGDNDKIKLTDYMVRLKVWESDNASYSGYDYPNKGFKVRKNRGEISDGKTQYVIYIAPCTSGSLGLKYQLEYTKKLTGIVKADSSTADKYYLIAHDKDVSETPGHGICSPVDDFITYKYQHEDEDPIFTSVQKSSISPSIEVCGQICLIVDNALGAVPKIKLLSDLNQQQATATAYENLI